MRAADSFAPVPPDMDGSGVAELATRLIRVPTPTGDEGRGAAALVEMLAQRGWRDARIVGDGNVVAAMGTGTPRVALLAYLDTGPAGSMRDAFDARILAGGPFGKAGPVVRGRGAVTKGALAASVLAAEEGVRCGGGAVTLVATCRDNEGLLAVLPDLGGIERAVQAEPTDLAIGLEARGIGWWAIEVEGHPAHAGSPAGCVNPIEGLARVIAALPRLPLPAHQRLPPATIAPVEIRSVRTTPLTPSSATVVVDRRMLPGERPEQVRADLEDLLAELSEEHPGLRATVSALSGMQAYGADPVYSTVGALTRAARAVLGADPASGPIPFATNAGLAWAAGIETVAFGPGRVADVGDEEHVEVDAMVAAAKILSLATANGLDGA